MNKSELMQALGAINGEELVIFRDGERMFSLASAEIQDTEPPIHAIVTVADLSDGEFKRIADERQAARDRAAAEEAERVRLAEEQLAKEQRAQELAAAAEAKRFKEAVAAEMKKLIDASREASSSAPSPAGP